MINLKTLSVLLMAFFISKDAISQWVWKPTNIEVGATEGMVVTYSEGGLKLASSSSLALLNGLSASSQVFATGTTGTDFNISSSGFTHTFNLPTASSLNRGLLSSNDWGIFNSKVGGSGSAGYLAYWTGTNTLGIPGTAFWDNANGRLGLGTTGPSTVIEVIGGGSGQIGTALFKGTYSNVGNITAHDYDYTYNPSGTQTGIFYGPRNLIRCNGSQIKNSIIPNYNVVDIGGTGAIGNISVSKNEVSSNNGGVITNLKISENTHFNSNAVANTNVYGNYNYLGGNLDKAYMYFAGTDPSGGFTPAEAYGFFCAPLAGSNTKFAFYAPGAADKNYFNGATGIGTNNPQAKLHIHSNAAVTTSVQRWQNNTQTVDHFASNATPEGAIVGAVGDITNGTTSGVGTQYIKESGSGNTGWSKIITTGNLGNNGWALAGSTPTAGIHFLGSTNNVSLRFRTNNVQRMIIDSVGFVGIGITPAVQLHTFSNGVMSIPLQRWQNGSGTVNQYICNSTPEGVISATPGQVTNGTLSGGTIGAQFIKVTGSGNTGWFEGINANNVNGYAWSLLGNTPTAGTNFIGSTNSISLRFRTNNLQRMVIDSTTGNIAIGGNADGGNKLKVHGKGHFTTKLHVGNAINPSPTGVTMMVVDSFTVNSKTVLRNKKTSSGGVVGNGVVLSMESSSNTGDVKIVQKGNGEIWYTHGYDASDGKWELCLNNSTTGDTVGVEQIIVANSEKNVGIQLVDPTAKLHIAAGTTSIAAFKIGDGPALTTAEANSIENDKGLMFTKSSGLRMMTGGAVKDFYTDSGNSGSGETDLYSWTSPVNTLQVNGDKLVAKYGGVLANSAATMQLRVYFGGVVIADSDAQSFGLPDQWSVDVTLIRTGTSTARAVTNIVSAGVSGPPIPISVTSLTGLNFATTNILKLTAQAGGIPSGDDIVAKMGTVSWYGAAND